MRITSSMALVLMGLFAFSVNVKASHSAHGNRLLRGLSQQPAAAATPAAAAEQQALHHDNSSSQASSSKQQATNQKQTAVGAATSRAITGLLGHSVAPLSTGLQQQQEAGQKSAPVPGPTAAVGILAQGVATGPKLSNPVSTPGYEKENTVSRSNSPSSKTISKVQGSKPTAPPTAMPPSRHLLQQQRPHRPHPLPHHSHPGQPQQPPKSRQLQSQGARASQKKSGAPVHAGVQWPPVAGRQ